MSDMNNLIQMVLKSQNGSVAKQAGQKIGMDAKQTESALAALMPAITSALKNNAQSPQGFAKLMQALQNGNHEKYMDDPNAISKEETVDDGNSILGHLFGSKDVSRAVASQAAEQTGIDSDKLKQFLPLVAVMAMSGLSKQTKQPSVKNQLAALAIGQMMGGKSSSKGLGGMLGGLLGGNQAKKQHQQGLGVLGKILDSNNDGNVMDDVLKKVMNSRK